jgi:hypothetical protein
MSRAALELVRICHDWRARIGRKVSPWRILPVTQRLADPSPDKLRMPQAIKPSLQHPPGTVQHAVAKLLEQRQVKLQKALIRISAHVASSRPAASMRDRR